MSDDPYFKREAAKYNDPIPSREFILAHLAKRGTPANRESLCQALKLTTETQQEALRRRLRAMERDGQLVFTRRQCYALPALLDLVRGIVIGHRDGYGFLRSVGQKEDLFLSAGQMCFALHGDVVLAQPLKPDRRGRCEARIVRVLEPRQGQIVGRYFTEAGLGFVVPDDLRLGFDIAIPPDEHRGARQGQVVVVTLTQRPVQRMRAIGCVVEVLGERLAPGIETEIAIRNHNIPHLWPEAVTAQIADLTEQVPADALVGRVDLRHLPLVTIDGEDARDFDDAVYCETHAHPLGGWCLWVAIADVSHYVPVGTALDQEALNRGNSVYFPTQVIPMLPERLSNGLCSLNPNVDRLCMVCEMIVSPKGQLTESKFYPAVMNSKARLTYTKVAQILAGDKQLSKRYTALVPHLQRMHQLFLVLKKAREQRGGIEFETQETQFIFNDQCRIERIVPLVRNDAHKIIEECMILANTAAAQFVQKQNTAVLYRVHDAPNEERLNAFNAFLQELGLSLGKVSKVGPKQYANLMHRVRQRPDRELIQAMLLRAMQPAIYSPDNRGHFGLALEGYAHFTSPIRRYPDLTLHRAIKTVLAQQPISVNHSVPVVATASDGGIEVLVQLGEHCSMTERRADEATREVADWLKCEFMQDHVGKLFKGVVSGVTGFGLFVRLAELSIDGLVHVTTLDNDYYHFDAAGQRLVGETLGRVYRLGDVVQVKVVAVHLDERKIELALIASERRSKHNGLSGTRMSETNNEKKSFKPTQAKPSPSKKSVVMAKENLKSKAPVNKKTVKNSKVKSTSKHVEIGPRALKTKVAADE